MTTKKIIELNGDRVYRAYLVDGATYTMRIDSEWYNDEHEITDVLVRRGAAPSPKSYIPDERGWEVVSWESQYWPTDLQFQGLLVSAELLTLSPAGQLAVDIDALRQAERLDDELITMQRQAVARRQEEIATAVLRAEQALKTAEKSLANTLARQQTRRAERESLELQLAILTP